MIQKAFTAMISLLSFALMVSCGPDDGITISTDLIADADDANEYIETIYSDMISRSLFTDAFVVMPLLFSDNCLYSGNQSRAWKEASQMEISTDNAENYSMYTDLYNVNFNVSILIGQLDTTEDVSLTEDVKAGLYAEGRGLRALAYFYLTSYWGEVPLILPNDGLVDSLREAATEEELFAQMESDLLYAVEHISKNPYISSRQRFNELAARAFLARLYLRHGDYADALTYAESVINSPDIGLETDVEAIYQINSNEHVWVLPENQLSVSLAVYFLQTFSNGQYIIRPRAAIPFETDDMRREFALSSPGTTILKYDDVSGNSDPVYMVRLAEMYLLAAEAAVRSTSDYSTATDYINVVRNRAGLDDIELTSGNFETAILAERNAELCYEGFHRLMDLRRFGMAETVLGPYGYDAKDALWPIPTRTLAIFKSLEQNEGYE